MEPGWRKSAMAVFPLYSRLMLLLQKVFVGVIPGRVRSTRAGNPYPQAPWLWFRARCVRSRVYPKSALQDAHIGNSRSAVTPRNDF